MSVYSDLEKIKQIKKQIHTSIANKEVAIADDLPFDQYPSKIDKITGGGGSISGQEFTITNNTGSDIKQGDLVWVDWAPYVESESKINKTTTSYPPPILDPSGQFAYAGRDGLFFSIDGLTVENVTSEMYNSDLDIKYYIMSENGELFYSPSCYKDYGSFAYRSDLIYRSYQNLIETLSTYDSSVVYAGCNNFFLRFHYSSSDLPYIQLFQINTSTGQVLKKWQFKREYWDRWGGEIFVTARSCWVFSENEKFYLIDFYHGIKYELDMNSAEDNPTLEGVPCQALGDINVKGITKDGKYIFVATKIGDPEDGGTSGATRYPLQIYKKLDNNFTSWQCLSQSNISSNFQQYYNNYIYDYYFYNPINQVITVFNSSRNAGGVGNSQGIAFKYIGENESGQMILEKLPCDTSNMSQNGTGRNEWIFGPTYSQDCGKYIIAKSYSDGKNVREYQVGYAKTGIFLKAVKDPSKLGAFAIQGVAKQNIANNGSGQIVTLALEKVNIQLNSDVELDDILVSTGV